MFFPYVPRLPISDFEFSVFDWGLMHGVTLELFGKSTRFLKNLWLSSDLSLILLNFLESDPYVPLNSLRLVCPNCCCFRLCTILFLTLTGWFGYVSFETMSILFVVTPFIVLDFKTWPWPWDDFNRELIGWLFVELFVNVGFVWVPRRCPLV